MNSHTRRSAARGTTVAFRRAGAWAGVLGLALAGLLLAAACGHKASADQTLRTCVDRWNQDNMVDRGRRRDLDLRAQRLRRLLVSAAPRAHRPALEGQERDDRQAWCADARLAVEGHASDAAARVAAPNGGRYEACFP